MKIIQLIQGTPEWHAHRAQHFNASDAPAMLGCSPYKSRAQLVREIATGLVPEIDNATQERFDNGHRAEALARPLAEQIIGEDLFPCVGVCDSSPHSASFDGLTLMGDTAFEHKALNDDLRAVFADIQTMAPKYRDSPSASRLLPKHYRVQMEQQLMVSGAERVLFMASKWNGSQLVEETHCRYYPDPELRAEIIAGWEQFAADVAAYQPEAAAAPAAVGHAPEQLPALHIEVTGMVTASNLVQFKTQAMAVLGKINRDLQTDEDFADAEQTVKWCKGVEDRLEAAKAHALSQTTSIDELFRTIDSVSGEARKIRLELDKLVAREKDNRRAEIVRAAVDSVSAHITAINATLGEHALQVPSTLPGAIGAAIKGKRTITSIRDAADGAAAQAKIDASQRAERIRACVAVLGEFAEHTALFADRVQLCAIKDPADLRNLAKARVADHEQREADRLEAERTRIRQEEAARLEREIAQQNSTAGAPAAQQPLDGEANNPSRATGSRNSPPSESVTRGSLPSTIAPTAARIKLGDINAAFAPLSISAEGLASLGFHPVASRGAAKLYDGNDFPAICAAVARVVARAPARIAALPLAA